MALEATLQLEGKSYDVRDLDYEIKQAYDNNLKPSANPTGGLINFTILSPMEDNLVFHEWVLSIAEVKNGEFFLPLAHGIKHTVKKIAFENAYCVCLNEYYSNSSSQQLYMRLKIVAPIIKFGDTVELRNRELPEK